MNVFADTWDYLLDGGNWVGQGGLLALLVEQLLLTVTALLAALVVGLPIALTLGHLGKGGFLAINISNVGRAVPTFALLAVLVTADWPGPAQLGPYGRGGLATLIALMLFALPPIITNAYVAIREVPTEFTEAAVGMGMTGTQVLRRVEIPLGLPVVLSGIRLALVQVWATATIAALVAGPGLGRVIVDGFSANYYGKGIAGAVVVAVVALGLEGASALLQRAADPVRRASSRKRDPALSAQGPMVSESAGSHGR